MYENSPNHENVLVSTLVTLLKMKPHYSRASHEHATQTSSIYSITRSNFFEKKVHVAWCHLDLGTTT